jgi:UDP-N-acetyl-D-galactosamine dehydrogenase
MQRSYGLPLTEATGLYDAVAVAVAHRPYLSLTEKDFLAMMRPPALLADIKGIYRNGVQDLAYWSL